MLLKKVENHDELVKLANALLLGHVYREVKSLEGRRFRLALMQPLTHELATPSFSRMRSIKDLFDILDFSNALAPEISEIYNSHDKRLSDRSLEKHHWIQSVFKQGAEIATVCLDGFPFLKAQTDWNDFGKTLEQADPDELKTPVALLQPTEVIKAVEFFIITHFRILLTHAIGLGRAEAQQIGWNGVRARLSVLRPPDPQRRASDAARLRSEEKDWLEETRAKANRLLLVPMIDKFECEQRGYDIIPISQYAMSLWPFDKLGEAVFQTRLDFLGTKICDLLGFSEDQLETLFPFDRDFRRSSCFDQEADADPAEFLAFAQEQIGWLALQKGWALCIAEDISPTNDSILSRVSPETFAPLHASARILKPSELGVHRGGELHDRALRLVGADRIWFALTHEIAERQAWAQPLGGPRSVSDIQREKEAQKVVNQLHAVNPDARMVRADASIALEACGFSQKAAGRIWDNSATESWKMSGKPHHGIKRLSSDDLVATLLQAGFELKNSVPS